MYPRHDQSSINNIQKKKKKVKVEVEEEVEEVVVVVVYAMVSCAKLVSLVTGPLVAQLVSPGVLGAWRCSRSAVSVVVTLSGRPGESR